MRKAALPLALLLVTLAVPGLLLWRSAGGAVAHTSAGVLALLGAGLLIGNARLWQWTASERFQRTGWLVFKGLLFNSGWLLASGLLVSGTPVPAVAPAAPPAAAENRVRDQAKQILASGDPAAVAQLNLLFCREALAAMQQFQAQLEEVEGDAKVRVGPLLAQTRTTAQAVAAEMQELERTAAAAGAPPSPAVTAFQELCAASRTQGVPSPGGLLQAPPVALPPAWRQAILAFGYVVAVAGLILEDELLIGFLLYLFPFLKSAARRAREKAAALLAQAEALLAQGKTNEAAPLLAELEVALLPSARRPEAAFYRAFVTLTVEDLENSLPFIEQQYAGFPDFQPLAYLMAYASLSAQQYETAWRLWERFYQEAPGYLEAKHHYSCAALAWASQLVKEARVNEALPLFKLVRELGVHADAVPEGMQNAQLMEAAGQLRAGKAEEAAGLFSQVEQETAAADTLERARFHALAQLGHALVALSQGHARQAASRLDELLVTFHALTRAPEPSACSPERLLAPIALGDPSSLDLIPGQEASDAAFDRAAPPAGLNLRDAQLLRDLYFLRAAARLLVWHDSASLEDTAPRDQVLGALRDALYFDPAFPDALAVYGFLLHFCGGRRSRTAAATYLTQAQHTGFEEQALLVLLQRLRELLELHARTRTEMLDQLHQYLTDEGVPRQLKEAVLAEEAIRQGYRAYAGEVSLDQVGEREPSLTELRERSRYLAEEMARALQELQGSGDEHDRQRAAALKEALQRLAAQSEEAAKVHDARSQAENRVVIDLGKWVLSQDF